MRKGIIFLVLSGITFAIAFIVLASSAKAYDFKEALLPVLKGADELVLNVHRGEDFSEEFVFKGVTEVSSLLEAIEFDDEESVWVCDCAGEASLHFKKAGKVVATLSYHHGGSLRWNQGPWPADGELTDEAQGALPKWFADRGFALFQQQRDQRIYEHQEEKEEWSRFFAHFPKDARDLIEESEGRMGAKALGRKIARLGSDKQALVVAMCKALSESSEPWNSTGIKEAVAIAVLENCEDEVVLSGFRQVKKNAMALSGVGRIFYLHGYDKVFDDQSERNDWALLLAELAIRRGDDGNRPRIMRYLRGINTKEVHAFFWDIFDEKITMDHVQFPDFGEEPGLRPEAALSLAISGDDRIKGAIAAALGTPLNASDRAAYELCLAFLGEPSFLNGRHFTFQSGIIGFAALRAIEMYNGAYGMNVLVDAGLEHPWAAVREEAVLTFERISGERFWRRVKYSRASWHTKDIRSWWAMHGEAFIESRRNP